MRHKATVISAALAAVVGLGPAVLVFAFGRLDPQTGRRWVWAFLALAVAMLGIVYGGDWETWFRRRRQARARVRRALHHGSALCREARRGRTGS